MATNIYGVELDRNGYAPSIMQFGEGECYVTGLTSGKLDRHEIFHGAYRTKSKQLGLWVMLNHELHMELHQKNAELDRELKETAQIIAMLYYKWSEQEFINQFGKNYL